jgi:hypothetical protein
MLPLIFGAGDDKKGIFIPFNLGIRIISLCRLKNISELCAVRKVMYYIERKDENDVKNTDKIKTSGGGERYRYQLYCRGALEQNVCKMLPI